MPKPPTTTWPSPPFSRIVRAVYARSLALAALALSALACGGAASSSSAPSKTPTAAAAEEAPLGPNQLRRRDLMRAISGGPGVFLGTLDVEAVLVKGRFHGWRIVAFHEPATWANVDLKPGDVVLRVNDHGLERPEDAMVPWQGLAIANELRVTYERGGKVQELRYEILDEAGTPDRP